VNGNDKYTTYGIGTLLIVSVFIVIYPRLWEIRQKKQIISQASIQSITPYSMTNDLHWSSQGFRVHIVGENRPIDFPSKNWDNTVKIGDTVELVVRQSFRWFSLKDELDGLSIVVLK
jgi:hypothetical protein